MSAGFPKRLRPSLSSRMEILFLEILEHLTTAAYTRNRAQVFNRIDDSLNRLRVLVRLAHEIGVISDGQYGGLARTMTETGKMIGGWRRSGLQVPEIRPKESQKTEPEVPET
ncbi:MAG TPA: four helix bundle protein [Myxococcota bacterium]|nr:four helix bundle protein [Myxococcota bacterium]HPB51758.1 four helix bundle protein [Myxococcota bacterium]